ncbi:fructosamine kinase family protein [Levilactobacillus bambusae]|uniref:Aminoglycoside phosphotransferase n=1 Tax=Levilactobacillus bambusae TaxID=2024736 RepID=A0A2V1N264_9LACO|nr:fructosamine kinase family protein [Levilactobacillus bambusae]PWG00758.1 aminoglycoside phosphotransferase [Levilactobacillus bambusae]
MTLSNEWFTKLPLSDVTTIEPVKGGDINLAFHLVANQHDYFLLVQPGKPQAFYQHEVDGLNLIGKVALVPGVVATGEINGNAFLILEWLASGSGSQYRLGQTVAHIHQVHNSYFGFDHDELDARIPKINTWQSDWGTFYTQQRLDPLVLLAKQNGYWSEKREAAYQQLRADFLSYTKHRTIKPSLLHGDLWSGNYMFTADGTPALIDPDVLYGDREFDLAMTTIFGGFSAGFYQGYTDTYPLSAGYEDRLPWYQLYYLLVHLNLFGETYGTAVDQILFNA